MGLVPCLYLGDLFVACNPFASLMQRAQQEAEGVRALRGSGSGSGNASGASGGGGGADSAAALRMHPAVQLLASMSEPMGQHKLLFVSKEAAEGARRSMVLRRYHQLLQASARPHPLCLAARLALLPTARAPCTPHLHVDSHAQIVRCTLPAPAGD
jgi:hypothetical protein